MIYCKYLTAAVAALIMASTPEASAADDAAEPSRFKISPVGRVLMDGAVYIGGNGSGSGAEAADEKFVSGVSLSEVRLGAKASFDNWSAIVEVGYANSKFALRDAYVQFDFDTANRLRAGYFVHQYGLYSACNASTRPTMIDMTSNTFFDCNTRNLGVMYVRSTDRYLGTASAFVEGNAVSHAASAMGKQGWALQTRQLFRPLTSAGRIAQGGVSLNYSTPRYNSDPLLNHRAVVLSSTFPTKVSAVDELEATVPDARGSFKFSPELLVASGRVALESQYYYMRVFRKGASPDYTAQGVYGVVRGLLIAPTPYGYNRGGGGLALPSPGSLEMVAGYDYTNANDLTAGIAGGIATDISCTVSYYINRWMIARLRYSYTDVHRRDVEGLSSSRHVNTLQARFQFIF